MTFQIIIQIILFAIALAMDAFSVSITDGFIYKDINNKRSFFIAITFGFMQLLMPLIGYYAIELINVIVGTNGGEIAINIFKVVITWTSFMLLMFIGGKMIIEGFKTLNIPIELRKDRLFSIKEVLLMGIATSIDVSSYSWSDKTSTVKRFVFSMC